MMDDPPFEPDRALFERWRGTAEPMATGPTAPPDALLLAAYAEGRLTGADAERVEAALAADPELLDTLLALRLPPETATPSAALIRSAQALVTAGPVVVPFTRRNTAAGRTPGRVNAWLAWGAVAASLLLVSMVGFDLGMRTGHVVGGPGTNAATAGDDSPNDLLDLSNLAGDDIG
jgi:plasmid stabilization system protein ParE